MRLKRKVKVFLILGIALIVLACIYSFLTSAVDKSSNAIIEVNIKEGTRTREIARILKEKNLIKNEAIFVLQIKLQRVKTLKASVYEFKKNMSLTQIISILEKGNSYNPNVIAITFKEGKTVSDYAKLLAEKTNYKYEDIIAVINDKVFLSELISKYSFLTSDILNSQIYYPLEGYLAPDTYHFNIKESSIKDMFCKMLDNTEKKIKDLKFNEHTIHEYFTLASMVELEGVKYKDRRMIAGVFYNRLANNMNLGSDVTTYYAFQKPMVADLYASEFQSKNPYNTRGPEMEGKFPIGPICNPSIESIKAVANYTKNPYLYFVADKNGNIYYHKTSEEQAIKVKEIKENGDWIW